ncbi:hypothetical protein [Candidatus Viridilinea mediisalina]|uniref:Uncharacterized protein n=1 Tax=Candidatus Viridilinea mediisalina TaxID=2024553 RepID=A0A2A6RDS4_9CHLR|nr:hypothetical protein [Candidatus Viridilinea mediisalina]PDW00037.1 hypothetical protein CJ255_21220 [Candidatus Viridilinea mediisalina]
MSTMTLEDRVAMLEQELRMLKQQLAQPAIVPWWEQINGVFAATPAFDEAIHLGRQYREAQRSPEGFAEQDAVIHASGSN